MQTVLVVNRGAIAVRVIRTLQRMGLRAVAVFHEHDRGSRHVALADHAVCLGDGRAADTYLNVEKILQVARETGADAIHPGYGFLSENADFVDHCENAGIIFLGPTADQMRTFAYKHAARDIALGRDVPLVPGSGLINTPEQAVAEAARIGYPVMLKSTAGGGGIGMRICRSDQEVSEAFASVSQLAASNFGDARLFLEKYFAAARHVEVQVFGDGRGEVIALGERDCSVQRRNQKVIEEAPAPGLSEETRQQMRDAAVRLCGAVKYRSAGTVEFLYDAKTAQFYFLEVNTRIQVEHGVTEQIYGVDLVEWMVKLGADPDLTLDALTDGPLTPKGWATQARVYAEDPGADYRPNAGLITQAVFPEADGKLLRFDHWIEAGVEVSPLFDPLLGKLIAWGEDREAARKRLDEALAQISLSGVETNIRYAQAVLADPEFIAGRQSTSLQPDKAAFATDRIDVLDGGAQTTVQDYPGRLGYWDVGVPPGGPMDWLSFRLGNRALGNPEEAPGLEIVLRGPRLKFARQTVFMLAGAAFQARLNGTEVPFWTPVTAPEGSELVIGESRRYGGRCYLLIAGGIDAPEYLGSRGTFILGRFGGPYGRQIRAGDVLKPAGMAQQGAPVSIPDYMHPPMGENWVLRVMYGPHGAPDFFTQEDVDRIFGTAWKVHFNSDRTGVRLIGPKPRWAREDGGEAGLHPSNLHDNAYSVGSMDFTGDMPVLIGPDGPSLGGFVCPAVVITADLWKLGQLAPGDTVRFQAVTREDARIIHERNEAAVSNLYCTVEHPPLADVDLSASPVIATRFEDEGDQRLVFRPSGDGALLVEFGPNVLDLELRFRAHRMMLWLRDRTPKGIREITPGIRSLQIAYDNRLTTLDDLIRLIERAAEDLRGSTDLTVPSRIVTLPLAWNDSQTRLAIEKYLATVRADAPWGPSNIEFIRRINGLADEEAVRDVVFNASYLVLGLGDVYLGAPVATPYDPRHRLVTTKYNPARTWTPENAVGIGGSYMCIYGMEGPGGYQFVGRTIQIWNRFNTSGAFAEHPWLLRFFDQIRYREVSEEQLLDYRKDVPFGRYDVEIQEDVFDLREYRAFKQENAESIAAFKQQRQAAFEAERQSWQDLGTADFQAEGADGASPPSQTSLKPGEVPVTSTVSGSIWKFIRQAGEPVKTGDVIAVMEAMKMEVEVLAPEDGRLSVIYKTPGTSVEAGSTIAAIQTETA